MEYISVKEAAEKWKVSPRRVQIYCSAGRIEGIKRFGRSWSIPLDANKPGDPRGTFERENKLRIDLFSPIMYCDALPGELERAAYSIEEVEKSAMFRAELRRFQGKSTEALELLAALENTEDLALRLGVLRTQAVIAMNSEGNSKWEAYWQKLADMEAEHGKRPALKPVFELIHANISTSMLSSKDCPEWLLNSDFSSVPAQLLPIAYYVQVMYLFTAGEFGRAVGAAEAYIELCRLHRWLLAEIYLHLCAGFGWIRLGSRDRAQRHIAEAALLSRPDGLVKPIEEFHPLLDGLDSKIIKSDYAEMFAKTNISNHRYKKAWISIHNTHYDGNIATDLTDREIAVLLMAKQGLTNDEISDTLNISANTVKYHMSNALGKLGLASRNELGRISFL